MDFVSNLAKTIATGIIWVTCVSIAIFAVDSTVYASEMLIAPLVAAVMGTLAIWALPEIIRLNSGRPDIRERSGSTERGEKAKRGARGSDDSRLALLLDLMDDDEREAFKEALKQRILSGPLSSDGEFRDENSLEALLEKPRRR